MRWFGRRLVGVLALAFLPMSAAVFVTPAGSECKQPPPPPAWYTPPPSYAPSFAGQNVPPPPPWPWWSPQAPMWSTGFQHWGVYLGGVWVPI